MKKKKVLIAASVFLMSGILFFGCSKENEEIKSIADSVIPVETMVIKKGSSAVESAYSGTIEESESQSLSFPTIGTVSKVFVSEGDFVKKGQLLAALDDATYRNTYEIMLAKKKQADDAFKRLEPMYRNGTLPEIKMVEIETAVQEAKSALAIAKKNLDDCKLYAPMAGYIGKRTIDPGMSAAASLMAMTIVKIEKVFAKVSVPENEISQFKSGQKAMINIAAIDESFPGIVEETGVIGDMFSHTYKIKIGIQNKGHKIKPGMVCNVNINKINNDTSIIIPAQAIQIDNNGKNYVYIADQTVSKTVKKYIIIGSPDHNGVVVKQGLNENDILITSGYNKIMDGSNIKIINR